MRRDRHAQPAGGAVQHGPGPGTINAVTIAYANATAQGVSWATRTATAYEIGETAYGAGQAGYNLYNDEAGWGDLLAVAPLVGDGLGRAGRYLGQNGEGLVDELPMLGSQFDVSDDYLRQIGEMRACFVAGTEVHGARPAGGVWLASAGVLLFVSMDGLTRPGRRRERKKRVLAPPPRKRSGRVWLPEAPGRTPADDLLPDLTGRDLDEFYASTTAAEDELPFASAAVATVSQPARSPLKQADMLLDDSGEVEQLPDTSRSWLSRGLFASLLLLAAFCGWNALNQPPATRPIEDIRVGQRVLGENPLEESSAAEVEPATWRKLTLRAPKADGSWADIELLEPLSWLTEQQARVGGTVHIAVPECGIDGDAQVLAIEPCPPIEAGAGPVVTGTFRHHSVRAVDLYVEGLDEPIGVTVNHPFWSEDRQQFVRADQLREGERLRGLEGHPRVVRLEPRAGTTTVYNLRVHGEHVYHVAAGGLLVHNTGPCAGRELAVSGRPAENAVSAAYDAPLNRGPGRQGIDGTGPGGVRYPDVQPFGPNGTIAQYGEIWEVKDWSDLYATQQLRDMAEYARNNNLRLRLFTDGNLPTSGDLADFIQRRIVRTEPIPW